MWRPALAAARRARPPLLVSLHLFALVDAVPWNQNPCRNNYAAKSRFVLIAYIHHEIGYVFS